VIQSGRQTAFSSFQHLVERNEQNSRWIVALFGLAATLLIPTALLLAVLLPPTHRSEHWDVAWAGFDVFLALALSAWLEGAAAAAATLLFVDAWFDVLTASTQAEFVLALVEAILVELPLALFCVLLARGAEHRLARPRLSVVPEPLRTETVEDDLDVTAPGAVALRMRGGLDRGTDESADVARVETAS
jgi:hypothetical protein